MTFCACNKCSSSAVCISILVPFSYAYLIFFCSLNDAFSKCSISKPGLNDDQVRSICGENTHTLLAIYDKDKAAKAPIDEAIKNIDLYLLHILDNILSISS